MRAARLVVLLCLGLFVGTPGGSALGPGLPHDPTPQAPNAVTARYELTLLESLDALELRLVLDVFEAELRGQNGVPAQQIRDGGDATRGVFEAQVRSRILVDLRAAFPETVPQLQDLRFDYGQSDADENLFLPAIRVQGLARIPLTNALLGFPDARETPARELAAAFFFSGGRILLDRPVSVAPGFDATFAVSVPSFLRLDAPGVNGTRIEFPRDNLLGETPKTVRLRFGLSGAPGMVPENVAAGPRVRATFIAHDETPLWLQLAPFTKGRYSADLDLWIELHSLDLGDFESNPLPGPVKVSTISADLLRIAAREGVLASEDLHAYFAEIITSSLEEGFGKAARIDMDEAAFQESLEAPIGGRGRPVLPVLIHATAHLPLKSDKMLLSSTIGRTLGMITGIPAKFPMSNEGSWRTELTLLYPEGVDIEAHDSLGRLQPIERDGRQGFVMALEPGETSDVRVHGTAQFQPWIFLLGLLEIGCLVALGWWLTLKVQALRHNRRAPWAPKG